MSEIEQNNVLLLDLDTVDASYVFNINVMQNTGFYSDLHTTMKVTKCKDTTVLVDCKTFGEIVAKMNSSGVQKNDRNLGDLHTFGMHCHNGQFSNFSDNVKIQRYQGVSKQFVKLFMLMGENIFPPEKPVMVQSEYSRGITSSLS